MGIRGRKHRPAARPLEASWIIGAELPQSSSASTMGDGSTLSQKDTNPNTIANSNAEDTTDRQRLRAPEASQAYSTGSRSSAPSQSSGGFGPPAGGASADDKASVKSQQCLETTPSREQKPAKAGKKRYASKHQSHWLEEAAHDQPQANSGEPRAASGRPQPQADSSLPGNPHARHYNYNLGYVSAQKQAEYQPWGVAAAKVPQAPSTKSPSIFCPSPYGTKKGCDAPPISPMIQPDYSPSDDSCIPLNGTRE
ncbi:hypothetical protein QQZ08_006486 [Neonectria magnoliae]|uniref:Uncharacterized protein n=1 Tax=Neonectria magnoliae TaxID=2732573 RepID=A0ABR1I0M6_9HYPO